MDCKECKVCKESKEIKDFLGKETCFHCQYQEKLKKLPRVIKCKGCGKQVPKTRWVFCSVECAEQSKIDSKYWTRTFHSDNKDYKKRFNY